MSVRVSKANAKDLEKLYTLIADDLWPKLHLNKRKTLNILRKQYAAKKLFLKATIGKEIVGFVSLVKRLDTQEAGTVGTVEELVVKTDFRSQGIGRKLMEALMQAAKKQGCIEVQLTSNMKRKDAHAFYKKLGFQSTAYLFWKQL